MRAGWIALVGMLCLASPAAAQHRCRVPLGEWQPREALQSRLEQQGWTVLSIRADDGCYKVRARNADGERVDGKFDPATLEPVARHDGRDPHGEDDND